VKAAGLTPVVMDVDAFAIENMFGIAFGETDEDTVTLVNIGASVMNVNIVRGGVSLFTRDIPLGGNRYSEAIQREMGVSFEEAEQLKKSDRVKDDHTLSAVVDSVNAEVASEIARTIDYFKTTSTTGDISRVLLCGGGAKIKGLAQQLRDRMHIDVDIANPFNEIDTSTCEADAEMLAEMGPVAAVGVGLALRTVGDR
jgi:type IV pilus assembly protein PilM